MGLILLQAAMAAGAVLFVLLGIFLLIGAPILTGLFMKILWKILGKEDFIKDNKPYHTDPLLYFPCLIGSISILVFIFYFLLLLFDKLNPDFLLYS